MSKITRKCGILLHPTSLPGSYGTGDLGKHSKTFLDILSNANIALWQILPLNPPGYGYSPYQSYSAFAGNPMLIDPENLVNRSWLDENLLIPHEYASSKSNAKEGAFQKKRAILNSAFERWLKLNGMNSDSFVTFTTKHSHWLKDYAEFCALKNHFDNRCWLEWPERFKLRDENALDQFRKEYSKRILYHYFEQYVFELQWMEIKRSAESKGISIIGDMPIFVALDSADVWANRQLFILNQEGQPTVVSGVPPDYFSETGQRWGNPLYDWDVLAKTHFLWWIDRFKLMMQHVHYIRVDHFRGFQAYWEIPVEEETAIKGRWIEAPGKQLFERVISECGELPIIAEDLGVITPEVEELRDSLGFPGMKVLQFGFSGHANNPHLPHNYTENCIVYTGTHDNDTTVGWFKSSQNDETIRKHLWNYLGYESKEPHWALIRLAFQSIARWAVIPAQDVLGLDSQARMNFPGTSTGNWIWQLDNLENLKKSLEGIQNLAELYSRTG
ncbi:4-alpha-glucanotransferase [bacterium]|nr:4-alpha-glucanotransferase [candidate division CSSED10-310 bacterium]